MRHIALLTTFLAGLSCLSDEGDCPTCAEEKPDALVAGDPSRTPEMIAIAALDFSDARVLTGPLDEVRAKASYTEADEKKAIPTDLSPGASH